MEDKTYNGWRNYETWCVNLWLCNDQGSDTYWRETAAEVWERAEPGEHSWQDRSEVAVSELADMLKEQVEESAPTSEASMYTDLLNAALSEVAWRDIADGMLEQCEGYEAAPHAAPEVTP